MINEDRNEIIERVYRPWGWYETLTEQAGYKVKRINVEPKQQLSLQKHHQRAEHWVVAAGCALVQLGENNFELTPGQHCDIGVGQIHRLSNVSLDVPLQIIEVQYGTYLGEDDIVRLQDNYGRQ